MALRILLFLLVLGTAIPATAQATRPAPIVEGAGGWVGFVDESWVHHTMVTAGARLFVLPRLAVGPELALLFGEEHYDWYLNAKATIDLRRDSASAGVVTPYFFGAYGYARLVSTSGFVYTGNGDWGTTVGFGTRIAATRRLFVAPEVRLGIPGLAFGLGVTVGIRPGR